MMRIVLGDEIKKKYSNELARERSGSQEKVQRVAKPVEECARGKLG